MAAAPLVDPEDALSAPPVWLLALCAAPARALALAPAEQAELERLATSGWPLRLEAGRAVFAPGAEPLEPIRIAAALAPLGVDVEHRLVLDSTQEAARRRLAQGAVPPFLVLAEWQSAGRGRLGRRWLAPPLSALLATLAVPLARPPSELAGLSPALGVATAEALLALGHSGLSLKWPNDLLRHGLKLGGLLIEVLPAEDRGVVLLVGLGLNVRAEAACAAPVPAASLAGAGGVDDRSALVVALVRALIAASRLFEEQGFTPFRARYARLDALAGRECEVNTAAGTLRGRALGLDRQGALLLLAAGGLRAVTTGEVAA